MDGITCALCGRAVLHEDRAIFLGIERLLLHGACYDEALEGLTDDVTRRRKLEDRVDTARKERST